MVAVKGEGWKPIVEKMAKGLRPRPRVQVQRVSVHSRKGVMASAAISTAISTNRLKAGTGSISFWHQNKLTAETRRAPMRRHAENHMAVDLTRAGLNL